MLLHLRNNNSWSSIAGMWANSRLLSSLGVGKLYNRNKDIRWCSVGISTLHKGPKRYSSSASWVRHLQSKRVPWEPAESQEAITGMKFSGCFLQLGHPSFPISLCVPASSYGNLYSGLHKRQNNAEGASQMQLLLWKRSTLTGTKEKWTCPLSHEIHTSGSLPWKYTKLSKDLIQRSSGSTSFPFYLRCLEVQAHISTCSVEALGQC